MYIYIYIYKIGLKIPQFLNESAVSINTIIS